MIINVHCHLNVLGEDFSWQLARRYEDILRARGGVCWRTGKPWEGKDFCVTPEQMINDMDRANVDKACIMGYVMRPMGCLKEDALEYIYNACKRYPDRLIGFYHADPLGGCKTVTEMELAVTEYGFKGVKLMPSYNYVAPNDRRLWSIYEKLEELGVPVLIHTGWSSLPGGKTLDYNHPLLLEDVLLDFPNIKIIIAHMGMQWYNETLAMMLRFPNVYADLAYWFHTPLFRIAEAMVIAKKDGSFRRLLWGSDYPENDFAAEIELYRRVPEYTRRHELEPNITDEDISDFLGGNACRLLELDC